MRFQWLVVLLFIPLMLSGCAKKAPSDNNVADNTASTQGQELFLANCTGCHPRSGRGDYLKRIPVTLLTRRSEQELMDWIRGSDQHREMPNFTNMSDQERKALANYLLSQIDQ